MVRCFVVSSKQLSFNSDRNQMPWTWEKLERSYVCNQDVLKFFRHRKRLSQQQLCDQSGVSVRVVSKAEAGATIATSSIDKLATALSLPNQEVFPEDLITFPLELTKLIVAATHSHKERLMDVVGHLIDPDAVFRIAGNPRKIPFAGMHRGARGYRRALTKFFQIFEITKDFDHTTAFEYFPKGTDVVLWGSANYRLVDSDGPTEKVQQRKRFRYRRGLLYAFDDHFDIGRSETVVAKAAEVLGSEVYDPLEDSRVK